MDQKFTIGTFNLSSSNATLDRKNSIIQFKGNKKFKLIHF